MYLLFLPTQKNMLWLKNAQLSLKENTKTKPLFSKSIMISRNVKLLCLSFTFRKMQNWWTEKPHVTNLKQASYKFLETL